MKSLLDHTEHRISKLQYNTEVDDTFMSLVKVGLLMRLEREKNRVTTGHSETVTWTELTAEVAVIRPI